LPKFEFVTASVYGFVFEHFCTKFGGFEMLLFANDSMMSLFLLIMLSVMVFLCFLCVYLMAFEVMNCYGD